MATLNRFEDIEAWQLARELCKEIYTLSQTTLLSDDFKLRAQINGSSGSVMDNIAEGFERSGNREFIQFLSIAKGSCGETRSQLYRVYDRKYITEAHFQDLMDRYIHLGRMLKKLIDYLKTSEMKGNKFKTE